MFAHQRRLGIAANLAFLVYVVASIQEYELKRTEFLLDKDFILSR